jgi:hypothetical protein
MDAAMMTAVAREKGRRRGEGEGAGVGGATYV